MWKKNNDGSSDVIGTCLFMKKVLLLSITMEVKIALIFETINFTVIWKKSH